MFSESFLREKPPANLEIGQVIGGAFSAIGRNWLAFLILTVPLYVLPGVAINYVSQEFVHLAQAAPSQILGSVGRLYLVLLPFWLITQPLFAASVAWMVWADEGGARPHAIAALRATASQFHWIILANLLIFVVVMVGTLLLFVPGIMAALALSAAIPACVAEKLRAPASLSRSLELTRGQRWRLLGLFVVVALLSAIPGLFIGVIDAVIRTSFFGVGTTMTIVTNAVVSAIGAVFGAAVAGAAYAQLRAAKEGVGSHSMAEVFA